MFKEGDLAAVRNLTSDYILVKVLEVTPCGTIVTTNGYHFDRSGKAHDGSTIVLATEEIIKKVARKDRIKQVEELWYAHVELSLEELETLREMLYKASFNRWSSHW